MKAYICINCGFSTIIKNRYEKCPVCNNEFTQLTNKESKICLNLKGDQRIQWIETKLGYSINDELNMKRKNYIRQKIVEAELKNKAEQTAKIDAVLESGRAVLEGRDKGNKFGVECPYCHATNVRKISMTSKAVHTTLFGIFSMSRNGKQWHCNNCNSDF